VPSRLNPIAVWLTFAAWVATTPGAARAQSVHRREAGSFGEQQVGKTTDEIDRCEPPQQLTEQEADARVEEHYSRGSVLYLQGDYDGAVDEFVAAYCVGHYPSILIDIGKAFERKVEYEKAVAYLERYIVDAPEDEEKMREVISYRVEVLRNTPARIRVATVPEGATITLTGPTGIAAQARANAKEPIIVRKGRYQMKLDLPGYESVTQSIVAEIGQPYSYYLQLQPKKGRVRVTAVPDTARIFVDDKLVGVGTYVDTVPVGTYKVVVEAPRRDSATRELEVHADRPTELRVELPSSPRSGRLELIVAATIGGGAFGTTSLSTIFGQDSELSGLAGLLGLGIGFGGGYFGIPDDITVGDSSFLMGSTLIGAAEGGFLASWIAGDPESQSETVAGVALASGVVGLGFAAATLDRFHFSAGDAALVNSGAMWGATGGALFWSLFDEDQRVGEPLILLGLNLGVLAGGTLASRLDYSRGHVALIDLSGLSGIVAGVALATAFPEDDGGVSSERLQHFALGGMTLGLISGAYLTRNLGKKSGPGKLAPTLTTASDWRGNPVALFGFAGEL